MLKEELKKAGFSIAEGTPDAAYLPDFGTIYFATLSLQKAELLVARGYKGLIKTEPQAAEKQKK